LTPDDRIALVFKVFQEYLVLVRKIQRTYVLEPAGSRGYVYFVLLSLSPAHHVRQMISVWSLDDHQFLPFYFGSAQLVGHANILPKSVRQKDIIEDYVQDYMYFQAVQFVLSVRHT